MQKQITPLSIIQTVSTKDNFNEGKGVSSKQSITFAGGENSIQRLSEGEGGEL